MTAAAERIRLLEDLAADSWPAESTEWLYGWRLGFTSGVTRRANSVLPTRWHGPKDPGPVLAAVEDRYRGRGLRPCFKLTRAALPHGLDRVLEARGYRPEGPTRVLTAETAAVSAARSNGAAEVPRLERAATPDWMATGWRERDPATEVPVLRAVVERIDASHRFALAMRGEQVAGTGLVVLAAGWGLMTAIYTKPEFRRGGVARAVLGALAGWAGKEGAPSLYLQVEADNRPAQKLFRRCGFRSAYSYRYWAI